jgi:putative ABC transport system substrate-binding protein
MLSRRRFMQSVSVSLLASSRVAEAQPSGRVYKLGVLLLGRQANAEVVRKAFADRLRELGWQEDRNLTIDVRYTDAQDRLRELASSLVGSTPDVLIAIGPYPAHNLKEATQAIPIVFAQVADPVGRGLVPSLGRPGGNITGVSHYVGTGMAGKPAQLLKELLPRAERLAWLINPNNQLWRTTLNLQEGLAVVARELKISAQAVEARTVDEVPAAIEAAARARADGLIVNADSVFSTVRDTIVRLTAKHRLPTHYPSREYVEAGGLMSYAANFRVVNRRAAEYVDKVLRGTKPADLPVEQPSNFELVINLKTARTLGLTIPPSLLLRADQVLE